MAANTVDSPLYPNHDNRRACPQSSGRLHEFISKGLAEFSSVVEIIRILELGKKKQQGKRLITDFIRFRHLMAHKRVGDLGYLQMMGAFVLFCRKTVGLLPNDRPIGSPATVEVLTEEFARMADINVVVCATWYFNIHNLAAVRSCDRQTLVTSLNSYAKNSSFSDYHFAVNGNDIIVTHNGEKKPFDGNLLKELAEVLKTPIEYNKEEIDEFKQLYKHAANIAKAESTHTEVQGVLRKLEIGCTCLPRKLKVGCTSPVDNLADGMRDMHVSDHSDDVAPRCIEFQ